MAAPRSNGAFGGLQRAERSHSARTIVRACRSAHRTGPAAQDCCVRILLDGGYGASSASRSYPSRLEGELRSLLPERDIVVVNRGVNGEDAEEMLARLQRSVLAAQPDLVIWQVGTNALLDGYPMARERALIRQGIRRLLHAGIDVVLMDPQYAPAVTERPRATRFVELLDRIGRGARVGVFHRFAIMRYWNEGQKLPFHAFVKNDGLHMNDWAYDCTARLLAGAILEAVARTAPVL